MTIEILEQQLLDSLLDKTEVPYRDILLVFKNEGGQQKDAYALLEKMRTYVAEEFGEEIEDRVLDIMDIVTGYCTIDRNVWEDTLKT